MTNLEMAKKLWTEFGNVSIDDNDCIIYGWRSFKAGTSRFEIWKWFEEFFNVSVATDLMESEDESSKPWYFTFGTDKRFPYQDAYVVVFAKNDQEAVKKFRSRYPDRTPGVVNCSFWYSFDEWLNQHFLIQDQEPADIISSERDGLLTWDDIYVLAEDSACGSEALKRKDNARYSVDEYALEQGLEDPERAEIPEEVIESICEREGLRFDTSGNIAGKGY